MRAAFHANVFAAVLAGLIVSAWAGLWWWGQSPYARYLDHTALESLTLEVSWRAWASQVVLYVGGWTLMVVAMMLPTTLPLVEIFRRMTRGRSDQRRLVGLLVVGYLAAWLAFGYGAHVMDWFLHRLVDRSAWFSANQWIFGAGPLMLAGAFQFSRLKYRCLDKCRSPLSFVVEHWRGRDDRREAFLLGLHHGVFCVGCCWALMLLMFAVGTGNVGWMLVLAAVMATEKNLPWGRHLSTPMGVVLLAWGLLVALDHSLSWQG